MILSVLNIFSLFKAVLLKLKLHPRLSELQDTVVFFFLFCFFQGAGLQEIFFFKKPH